MMGNKLGLDEVTPEDISLINEFEKTLSVIKPDMSIFYQRLTDLHAEIGNTIDAVTHFRDSFYKELLQNESEALDSLIKAYVERIKKNICSTQESLTHMRNSNPRFILRNYLLHQAAENIEKGDDSLFLKLQKAMKEPYSKKYDEFFAKRPDWATQKAGCSMLSCSS
jgi:uncharacterized protein YdiU (UPF0061 family)